MKKKENVNLKNKNTFHIDGIAKNYYIPENEEDLKKINMILKNEKYYILSGGSNILINDKKKYESIVFMGELDKEFCQIDNNIFYVGASLKIQEVINKLNDFGYGGIEKLYSLPAMFGGIIYMNAGIGGENNSLFTISDFIIRVKVFCRESNKIKWIYNKDCMFGHRKSLFQNDQYIILGAECKFNKQDYEISKSIIKNRLINFGKKADMGKGTFGTVFSVANGKLLRLISIFTKKKGNVRFGKKNKNWLVNEGNGKYDDAIYLINKVEKIHKLFNKKLECEVRIWE